MASRKKKVKLSLNTEKITVRTLKPVDLFLNNVYFHYEGKTLKKKKNLSTLSSHLSPLPLSLGYFLTFCLLNGDLRCTSSTVTVSLEV